MRTADCSRDERIGNAAPLRSLGMFILFVVVVVVVVVAPTGAMSGWRKPCIRYVRVISTVPDLRKANNKITIG